MNTYILKLNGFPLLLLLCIILLYSCNNNQLVQQYKMLHEHDSLMMAQNQANDSTIVGYIHTFNDIQSSLDEIKAKEKILSVHGENKTENTAVEDIRALDNLIIKSNKEIAALHVTIKKMNTKNADMEIMLERMSTQLAEQDTEISVLQSSLAKVNNSYTEVTRQFNDSIAVLQNQNARIEVMATTINTVYYAIGTSKELKDNNVIDKTGGFIGIGRNSTMKPNFNSAYFTKGDLTKLQVISLNAKFKKLLSPHPTDSYKITGNGGVDSLWITNQSSFWRDTKYLVIAVK